MTATRPSYDKVFYDLRPAKQIERRMIIDALQRLQEAGFRIREYQYTGLGSIYFVDFILFHRLLGINDLLSVEIEDIPKRIAFNRPYIPVRTVIAPIGDIIPTLNRDKCHMLWLDYDARLDGEMAEDISLAATTLSPGSLLLITIDIEEEEDPPANTFGRYHTSVGDYFDIAWSASQFAPSTFPTTMAELLHRIVVSGLSARPNVEFSPLFSFEYADGHKMLTVGGMVSTDGQRASMAAAHLNELSFVRDLRAESPFVIQVPRLTRRERLLLDQNMPCKPGWMPKEFELDGEAVSAYREVYRYYPMYAELLF